MWLPFFLVPRLKLVCELTGVPAHRGWGHTAGGRAKLGELKAGADGLA